MGLGLWAKTGIKWIAFDPETWKGVLRVLKPGAYLLAFGGARTYHRMACAIEDAGFEIRDSISWIYGLGFPKSLDVAKAIDKATGAEREVIGQRTDGRYANKFSDQAKRAMGGVVHESTKGFVGTMGQITAPATLEAAEWQGWGTALKPADEPIIVARKPLEGTVAANVLKYGTGGLNIDACRVTGVKDTPASPRRADQHATYGDLSNDPGTGKGWDPTAGRWPANIVLTHSEGCQQIGEGIVEGYQINRFTDGAKPFGNGAGHPYESKSIPEQMVSIYRCVDGCPVAELNRQSGHRKSGSVAPGGFSGPYKAEVYGKYARNEIREETIYADEGGAARYFNTFEPDPFFYSPKASTKEREAGLDSMQLQLFGQSGGAQQALAEGKTDYQGEGGVELNRIKARKNNHPTVKPIALMRHLVKLVTPPGGICLDPFVGSGTTGIACVLEGFNFVGIDSNPDYLAIANERIAYWEK